jgi:hypothetical protein
MVYKIQWRGGGETAERYSSKKVAKRVMGRLSGNIVKTKLGSAGRTSPFTEQMYGKSAKFYPKGKRLVWAKTPTTGGFVYRTRAR